MLTYSFTNIGSDSMYEYLYKCIRNDITQGKIKAGEKLPSKRTFAKNLGISVITVENAYGQLSAEGYIYSMPKRGFYVSDLSSATMEKKKVRKKQLTLTGGATSYFADFSSNQTDSEIFPFTIWSKTVREVLNDNQKQLMINPPCGGILELRQAIARYLKEFRAMQVEPEQIIPVLFPTLSSIPWQNLWKTAVLKSISTGSGTTIRQREMRFCKYFRKSRLENMSSSGKKGLGYIF